MTIAECLANADRFLKQLTISSHGHEVRQADATCAAAFIARADLAVRLRESAGGGVDQLKILIRGEFWDRASVVPSPDGVTLLVSAADRYVMDGAKIWDMTKPWRTAGWQIQMLFGERCQTYGTELPPPYPHRYLTTIYNEETRAETGRKILPYCESCGYVPRGNNLAEVEIRGPEAAK